MNRNNGAMGGDTFCVTELKSILKTYSSFYTLQIIRIALSSFSNTGVEIPSNLRITRFLRNSTVVDRGF